MERTKFNLVLTGPKRHHQLTGPKRLMQRKLRRAPKEVVVKQEAVQEAGTNGAVGYVEEKFTE